MERRRYPRFADDVPVALIWREQMHAARTEDLSFCGARIVTDVSPEVGEVIEVVLTVPAPVSTTLELRAQVRWCRDGRLGLYFSLMRPADIWVLLNYLGMARG